ncbi:MAG TPA: prolyl-tRNA synthetase associated domain-containing protein [Patescibacteria group bacterium]|nr:prolyl-tRNA synthetase associated domain-containing protein [Patescibacteria group bacterium]
MTNALLKSIQTPDPLFAKFSELGIVTQTYEHPAVFTVEQGAGFKHEMPGGHTKNLFLKDKKDVVWLITALQDTEIDLKKLPARINAGRLSFGNAELMQALLGITPGSVTALGLVNDTGRQVRPILDQRIFNHDLVNCHPLRNDMTTALKPDDLVKFMKSLGYDPLIVDFTRL